MSIGVFSFTEKPNAILIFENKTINLTSVTVYDLNRTEPYVYIVSGYIQPYAYLSTISLFLILTGTFIGFKGTTLYFQTKILGEELTKGYAVGGSLSRYFLKKIIKHCNFSFAHYYRYNNS